MFFVHHFVWVLLVSINWSSAKRESIRNWPFFLSRSLSLTCYVYNSQRDWKMAFILICCLLGASIGAGAVAVAVFPATWFVRFPQHCLRTKAHVTRTFVQLNDFGSLFLLQLGAILSRHYSILQSIAVN